VLSADVFARFCRSRGYETLYICGTDEYGTATQAKAIEEGVSPREICDKYFKVHKEIYEWFGISTDKFGRTSTPGHAKLTQEIFLDLYRNNMLQEREVEQPYDEKIKMFLADRLIEGACPYCNAEDARADQCDKCGRLLTYAELKNPISKLSKTTPVLKKTKHLFLDLAKIQPELEKWIDKIEKEKRWSSNTLAIARAWLKEGLQARSITRDLEWGVPVPLKGWEGKVLYVWFDAPIGYISITAEHTAKWKEWWGGAEDVRHYEFIGKDNVPFHAIIFPAMLMGTAKKWTLPYYISSTEFLNYEGGKFSKSRGVGVFGNDAMQSTIPADVWRYYLIANRPETADSTFLWQEFGMRTNKELIGNWGNLVNRVLAFIWQNYDGIVPQPGELEEEDNAFLADVAIRIAREADLLEKVQIRSALNEFMGAASCANAYLQEQQPWKNAHTNPKRAAAALYCLANAIYDLAIACEPFLPFTCAKIFEQLNISPGKWKDIGMKKIAPGHRIKKPEHLYKPLDSKILDKLREKYSGKQAESTAKWEENEKSLALENLQLEIGAIQSVESHPNADKLYVEKVLLSGGEVRTICSGLAPYIKKEELNGRTCIVVKNLKPAKLRGIESQGMLLVAQGAEGEIELLSADAPAGTGVEIEGVKASKNPPIISIEEFNSIKLEAKDGKVYANSHLLTAAGKPICTKKVKDGKVS
jgi:methionyl-tRNA synthetase